MKGLKRFLKDTWWVFGAAAGGAVVIAVTTGWLLYLAFIPALVIVALYMSFVRYDKDGNERFPQPQSRINQQRVSQSGQPRE